MCRPSKSISKEEREKRRLAVDDALARDGLAGCALGPDSAEICGRYVAGELTDAEFMLALVSASLRR